MLQTVAFSVGFFGAAFRAGRRFFTRMFSDPIRAVIALQNESAFEWMQRGMVLDDTLRVCTQNAKRKSGTFAEVALLESLVEPFEDLPAIRSVGRYEH